MAKPIKPDPDDTSDAENVYDEARQQWQEILRLLHEQGILTWTQETLKMAPAGIEAGLSALPLTLLGNAAGNMLLALVMIGKIPPEAMASMTQAAASAITELPEQYQKQGKKASLISTMLGMGTDRQLWQDLRPLTEVLKRMAQELRDQAPESNAP